MQLTHYDIENKKHNKEIILILDHIHSPFNIGLIIRTAESMGVNKLFIISNEISELTSKVKRSSRSAEKYISVEFYESHESCLQKITSEYTIYSLEKTSKSIVATNQYLKFPCAIVCGNEISGVSDFWLKHSVNHFELPMYGKNTSINVAVAAGIFLSKIIEF